MKYPLIRCIAVIALLVAVLAGTATQAAAKGAPYSFDSLWFNRDGTRVVPEIGRSWITAVFDPRFTAAGNGLEPTDYGFVKKRAEAILQGNDRIVEYLYDPNIAENACFFRVRPGLKPAELARVMNRVGEDRTVRYVHPTLVLNGRTYAYFDTFELEWKTGIAQAQRESLLRAAHARVQEAEAKEGGEKRGETYAVDVTAIPFFRALGLLSEDIRVLKAVPVLVELQQSIGAKLSLYLSGGNIGDSIPFTLTITFSDRVVIDPSSIATINLRPPDIQKELFDCTFDPYDYAKAVSRSPIVITGRMRFYAPGEFTVPAVKISYSCPSCADKTVHTMETEQVPFRVSSIIPAAKPENRLRVPTDPVPRASAAPELHRQTLLYRWLAIASFAALALCALWLVTLIRRTVAKRDRHEARQDPRLLAARLRELLAAAPGNPHWRYLGEVGNLLREYLAVRCGTNPQHRGGSGREFLATVRADLPAECADALGGILAAIDDGVALESEHCAELDRLRREILELLERTADGARARG